MRKRDKKSFPKYEGKIIEWSNPGYNDGEIVQVKIAGCDYHIGYTLINPNDSDDFYTCMNGPCSPQAKEKSDKWDDAQQKRYDKQFEYLLNCIRNNKVYDVGEMYKFEGRSQGMRFGDGPTASSCSFL